MVERFVIVVENYDSDPYELIRTNYNDAYNFVDDLLFRAKNGKTLPVKKAQIYQAKLQLMYDVLTNQTFQTTPSEKFIVVSEFKDVEHNNIDHYETLFHDETCAHDRVKEIFLKATFPIVKLQIFSAELKLVYEWKDPLNSI